MTKSLSEMHNLLVDPLISTRPLGPVTLPGLLAALARDEVDSYPALRPHQAMFWHMFCVQLAAMALRKGGAMPQDEATWRDLLRAMTPNFPEDEPWSLIVEDWIRPAFMQAAVPEGVALKNTAPTPDALDILITSKNHDLKQATAANAAPEDWLFALVTLQTGEGYNGKGNQGIARMNGGSSSRALVGLAPASPGRTMLVRPGAWFARDVAVVTSRESDGPEIGYKPGEGLGLVWLAPWAEQDQLVLTDLDPMFIEICRRVRLYRINGALVADTGNSAETRVAAKQLNGVLGDPWAPIHTAHSKALTIGEDGNFDYGLLVNLLFSGNWEIPFLAIPASFETPKSKLVLVAQAIARGNSKTGGFRSREIPIKGKVAAAFGVSKKRKQLHEIGEDQAQAIRLFRKALGFALATAAAGGATDRITYKHATAAQVALDRYADTIFFPYLWRRFEGEEEQAKGHLICDLWHKTQAIFDRTLPAVPCGSLARPKAEAKARSVLIGRVMKSFSDYLKKTERSDDAA